MTEHTQPGEEGDEKSEASKAEEEKKLRDLRNLIVLIALGVFIYLYRSGALDPWMGPDSYIWIAMRFGWHLTGPTLGFLAFSRYLRDTDPDSMTTTQPGPLSFIPNRQLRLFAVIIMLPGMGFVLWNLQKIAFARKGARMNATVSSGMMSKDFCKSVASFVLLPMVHMVTGCYQGNEHRRLLQVVGTGLGLAVLAGVVTQILIFTFASQILGVFEGPDGLLAEGPFYLRIYCGAFFCSVLNETMIAVLAGTQQYIMIGECMWPMVFIALLNAIAIFTDFVTMRGHLAIHSFGEVVFTSTLLWRVMATLQQVREDRQKAFESAREEAQDPKAEALLLPSCEPGVMALLCDLEPSREVLREMVSASMNTGLRNFALRLKPFFSSMVATRLGNLQGSTFAIQQTIVAYLSGPAGSTGLFTANIAPIMLHVNSLRCFVWGVKGMATFITIFAGFWFYFCALDGPTRVLSFGGIRANASAVGSAVAWNATNASLEADATCSAATCSAAVNFTEAAVANATSALRSQDELQEYLQILTPLNHWLWAFGTLANEIAAPFDGVLLSLRAYNAIGAVYVVDFIFVLLPALFAADRLGKTRSCVLPGPLSSLHGCNSFTGVMFANLAWGVLRLLGLFYAVFFREVPRLDRRRKELDACCTREVVLGYVDSRMELPDAEAMPFKETCLKNKLHKFGADSPMNKWAVAHGTTMEAMTFHYGESMKGDPAFQARVADYLERYSDWM